MSATGRKLPSATGWPLATVDTRGDRSRPGLWSGSLHSQFELKSHSGKRMQRFWPTLRGSYAYGFGGLIVGSYAGSVILAFGLATDEGVTLERVVHALCRDLLWLCSRLPSA